ncbi:MAG: hypothetical protein RBR22_12395 [Desulfuromonas sp.]|nr:hypothetical protein [Desulfuromonas sp.]
MKKSSEHCSLRRRLMAVLAVITLCLAGLDLVVHHHSVECILPDFARYVVLSLLGSLALIGLALVLGAVLSRKEDYYDK